MIPEYKQPGKRNHRVPRVCGDDPDLGDYPPTAAQCTPRMRG